jgi:hypothetical protein
MCMIDLCTLRARDGGVGGRQQRQRGLQAALQGLHGGGSARLPLLRLLQLPGRLRTTGMQVDKHRLLEMCDLGLHERASDETLHT